MTTLFDALYATARNLRGLRHSTATGGSTTTLVDTSNSEPDNFFDNGTLFILSGANASRSRVISDWDNPSTSPTHAFTFSPAVTTVVAGVRYAAMDGGYYTREDIVAAINQALGSLGPFDQIDESLTTEADTEIYALPLDVTNIKRVWIASSKSAPYGWVEFRYWQEREESVDLGASLYLDENHLPGTGYGLRLIYEGPHAAVSADADAISGAVNLERLSWEAAYYAALNRSRYAESAEPNTKEFLAIAAQMRTEMRRFPVHRTAKAPRWNSFPED